MWRETVHELNTKPATPLQLHTGVTCFIDCGTTQSVPSLTFLVLPPSQSFPFTAAQLPEGCFFPSVPFKTSRGFTFSLDLSSALAGARCRGLLASPERLAEAAVRWPLSQGDFCPICIPQSRSARASRKEPRIVSHFICTFQVANPNRKCRLSCFY